MGCCCIVAVTKQFSAAAALVSVMFLQHAKETLCYCPHLLVSLVEQGFGTATRFWKVRLPQALSEAHA